MKKYNIVIGVVVIIIILFAIFSWVKPYTDIFKFESFPNSSENRIQFIENRGYEITEINETINSYNLTKTGLTNQHMREWSVQSTDPIEFVGKDIDVYYYKVKNHKLDNMGGVDETRLSLIACDGEIVGGCSYILYSEFSNGLGYWAYNIDGYSLETVTGKMYTTWVDEWMKKYQ